MFELKEDPIPPQYLPEGFHNGVFCVSRVQDDVHDDGPEVADMTDHNDDAPPPQDHTLQFLGALVRNATKLDGAERDATVPETTEVKDDASTAVEDLGHEELGTVGTVGAVLSKLPSYEQLESLNLEETAQTKTMQPQINDTLPSATSEPTCCTPASRSMYKNLEFLNKRPTPRVADLPAYTPTLVQPLDQDLQLMPRSEIFDLICGSVRSLDIKKLSAVDYEVGPRFEGEWFTWITSVMHVVATISESSPHSKAIQEYVSEDYVDQIVAGEMLIQPVAECFLYGLQPANPEDMEAIEWALNQRAQCWRCLEKRDIDLLALENFDEASKQVGLAIGDSLASVFLKYRVEALLELQPREPALDDWLHHQMRVCDEWFEKNRKQLQRLPETAEHLKSAWVFSLWCQWEKFLRDGFDTVLADIWEPELLTALLGDQPLCNSEIGAYPREALLEDGDYDTSPYWMDFEELEPALYEGYRIGNYLGDVTVINTTDEEVWTIDDTPCHIGEVEEGYVLASIPPSYREKKSQVGMKVVVSRLLALGDISSKKNRRLKKSVVAWLTRKLLQGRLDTSSIEWINVFLGVWTPNSSCGSLGTTDMVVFRDRRTPMENYGELK